MIDRQVHLGSLLAGLAWVASAALLTVAWVFALPHLGMIGVALSTVAATVTVLMSLRRLESRKRNAFDLGLESVRSMR